MSVAAKNHIGDQIRRKKLEIKFMRRRQSDPDLITVKLDEMETLLEKYNAMADGKYVEKNEDIAYDFCEEYFYELCKPARDEVSIGKFYDLNSTLVVVGNDTFNGKMVIITSIMEKFRGLTLTQRIDSVVIDAFSSKATAICFECKSFLQINDDVPRKILQIFELVRSSLPTTYPYVVKKEYFIVQDARPLYHWPEKPIPITKHDNWEPQFKPREVERPKSATVAAVLVEVAQVEAPVEEEEEAEDYDEEDDGELEEGGGQEKAEEGDGGGVEQQGDFVVEDSNCVKDADGGGENLEIADEDGEGYDGAMEEVNYQTTLEEYNQ